MEHTRQRGLFVTGTDTGVGKTILSAALLAAMVEAGESVRAHKPVVTGLADSAGSTDPWPADHELLGEIAGMSPAEVAPIRYEPAVSPHLAAELAGRSTSAAGMLAAARAATSAQGITIVEGVGGLLVPLTADFSVCDLAAGLGLGLLVAARPGLGTINHTLLTLKTARAAGLTVAAVVLTPWPQQPSALEQSNRETIARLGEVAVEVLPLLSGPDRAELAGAGAGLPWREWLED
jgi:dethiobiotin synthetase